MPNHIAIFIDAENLTKWIQNNGVQSLMDDLLPLGQIVVRKAYGKWSSPNLSPLQTVLNENGFELVHTFHPVSGKNSTDIKMTVDTMEVSLDSNVQCFVLATGDSDFSPLFRKLREQGKDVIGVGPKSPLSECVKNSCSRYIYTDEIPETEEEKEASMQLQVSERIDYMEAMEQILQQEDGRVHLSSLKERLLRFNNAFSEKRLGFKTFKDFVLSSNFTEIESDGKGTFWVSYVKKDDVVSEDIQVSLIKVLKKKKWDVIPKITLRKIYHQVCALTEDYSMSKQTLIQEIMQKNIAGMTSELINHAMGIFFKSKLITVNKNLWLIKRNDRYWYEIDKAMLDRICAGIKECGLKVKPLDVRSLFYGKYAEGEAEELIKSKLSEMVMEL